VGHYVEEIKSRTKSKRKGAKYSNAIPNQEVNVFGVDQTLK
jgi:hypothetical protein